MLNSSAAAAAGSDGASDRPSMEGLMIESVADSGGSKSLGKRSSFHSEVSIFSFGSVGASKQDLGISKQKANVIDSSGRFLVGPYQVK